MKRRNMRMVLDLALSAMLIFEMLYSLTGNALHEVVGAAFFVTLGLHMLLSRRWFAGVRAKAASQAGVPAKQKAQCILAIVLAVLSAVLLASSLLISNLLAGATGLMLTGSAYGAWSLVHTVSAYGLCAVAICHVGVHWVSLLKTLRISYDPARRRAIGMGVTSVAALGVAAVGMAAAKTLDGWSAVAGTASCQGTGECGAAAEAEAPPANGNQGSGSSSGRGFAKRERAGRGGSAPGQGGTLPEGGTGNGGSSSGSDQGSSGSATGTCPLCHERCPLSAPRCNKPYAAGLL